jgi:hypothetical protein
MTSPPKTIQIVLPSGEPPGIRIAEITTRIVQAIEVRGRATAPADPSDPGPGSCAPTSQPTTP